MVPPGGLPDGAARAPSPRSSDEDNCGAKPSKDPTRTVEAESDLRHFLKVVRPEWSCPQRRGHTNIHRVIGKLRGIGVFDTWELMRRVNANTINDDLVAAGHSRFSRDTMDKIRTQNNFIRALEHLKEPYYRQVGHFAPVPQLLGSGAKVRHKRPSALRTEEQQAGNVVARPSTTDPYNGNRLHNPSDRVPVEKRPSTVGAVDAMGLGDHGGVYHRGTSSVIASDSFASLLMRKTGSKKGALYLRDGRPRHGRSKQTQGKPIILCSLPDLAKLQKEPSISSATASADRRRRDATRDARIRSNSSGREIDAEASRSASPMRGPTESTASLAMTQSQSESRGDENEADSIAAQADKWSKTGNQISKEPWVAKWTNQGNNSLLRQGEAMLREQAALDDRRELFRVIELPGWASPMRHHVATKIQSRLHEHEHVEHDAEVLDTHQRCMNIRKSLGYMQAARRDLSEQKRRAQDVLGVQVARTAASPDVTGGLSAEMFRRSRCQSASGAEVVQDCDD